LSSLNTRGVSPPQPSQKTRRSCMAPPPPKKNLTVGNDSLKKKVISNYFCCIIGLGCLGVACWPLVPKFAGSNPSEAVRFLGQKNPQHAFLRRGSKDVGPMS